MTSKHIKIDESKNLIDEKDIAVSPRKSVLKYVSSFSSSNSSDSSDSPNFNKSTNSTNSTNNSNEEKKEKKSMKDRAKTIYPKNKNSSQSDNNKEESEDDLDEEITKINVGKSRDSVKLYRSPKSPKSPLLSSSSDEIEDENRRTPGDFSRKHIRAISPVNANKEQIKTLKRMNELDDSSEFSSDNYEKQGKFSGSDEKEEDEEEDEEDEDGDGDDENDEDDEEEDNEEDEEEEGDNGDNGDNGERESDGHKRKNKTNRIDRTSKSSRTNRTTNYDSSDEEPDNGERESSRKQSFKKIGKTNNNYTNYTNYMSEDEDEDEEEKKKEEKRKYRGKIEDRQELEKKEIQLGDLIASGSFAKVYNIKFKWQVNKNKRKYALKVINKKSDNLDIPGIETERKIINILISEPEYPKRIVRYLEFFETENCFFITMKKSNASLYEMLKGLGKRSFYEELLIPSSKTRGGFKFPLYEILTVAKDVIKALQYLKTKNIIHKDIKLENILLTGEVYKLTDFGLSEIVKPPNYTTKSSCGTGIYLAPEVMDEKKHSFSVDLWALGMLLYELHDEKHPLSHVAERKRRILVEKIGNVKNMKTIKDVAFKDLLSSMLKVNPNERIDLNFALETVESIKRQL